MFPVKCKNILPIDHVVINCVAIRGALGPLTVWVTKDEESLDGEISCSKKHWNKIYEKTFPPSFEEYKELDLSSNPIRLKPGEVKGVYIHSTRRGDEAIVYDNKENQKTHDDKFITILPGRAHVSERVFGSVPIWGWGSAWRDNREFVGQIKYGAVYRLWNPSENLSFGSNFRGAARTLFLLQRRLESPFSRLPDDAIFFILNMCRWDWSNDTSADMRREQKQARRVRRRQLAAEAESIVEREARELMNEAEMEDVGGEAVNGEDIEGMEGMVWGVDEDNVSVMEEDSSDDSEDGTNTSDSDEEGSEISEGECSWGDHRGTRNPLRYFADDSDSEAEDEMIVEQRQTGRRMAMLRARRHILSFLRAH